MRTIMFNEKYRLQTMVIDGTKPMTRREPIFVKVENPQQEFTKKGNLCLLDGYRLIHTSRYHVGEIVAVAQPYSELADNSFFLSQIGADELRLSDMKFHKGWGNKMYVKAAYMPNQIRITDIRYEKLQDISDNDCIKEGITKYGFMTYHWEALISLNAKSYRTPRDAFAALIDKVSGKGTWNANPFVCVYSFVLVNRR